MKKVFFISSLVLLNTNLQAQSSGGLASGITAATGELKSIVNPITTFFYVLAAIIAIFGAIKVFTKHQNGDQDTHKAMGQWGFAFVFLIAAGLIIKATFSV